MGVVRLYEEALCTEERLFEALLVTVFIVCIKTLPGTRTAPEVPLPMSTGFLLPKLIKVRP